MWVVAILDDHIENRAVTDAIRDLNRYGEPGLEPFKLFVTDSPDEMLKNENLNLLCNADVVLVDCQWDAFQLVDRVEFRGLSADVHSLQPDPDRLREWVSAIADFHTLVMVDPPARGLYPRSIIANDHTGIWLGAAISQCAPNAEMRLWSAQDNVLRGALAATACYRDGRLAVMAKQEGEDVITGRRDFWDAVERVQVRRIRASESTRRSFFNEVFFPAKIHSWKVPAGDKRERLLAYPQLLHYDGVRAGFEQRLFKGVMRAEASGLLPDQANRILMQAAKHAAENLEYAINRPPEPRYAEMQQFWRTLILALPRLGAIDESWTMKLIDSYSGCLTGKKESRDVLKNELAKLVAFLELVSSTTSQGQDEAVSDVVDACDELGVAQQELQVLMSVFQSNGQNENIVGGKFSAGIVNGRTCLTWVDKNQPFASCESFVHAASESLMGKGVDRGLPLALLFGYRRDCSDIQILAGEPGAAKWWSLERNEEVGESDASSGSGMRWVFDD